MLPLQMSTVVCSSSRITSRDYGVFLISATTPSSSSSSSSSSVYSTSSFSSGYPVLFNKSPPRWQLLSRKRTQIFSKSSEEEEDKEEAAEVSGKDDDEWLQRLPDKKKPLYSHSLPCVEAWLKSLGFYQSKEDRAVWFVENPDWHAHLSLDVTDLYIRYLKGGPGNLEKDVERRFSYALSREDIENAILGGP